MSDSCGCNSADQLIIVGVGANPEPERPFLDFDGQRSMAQPDADGSIASDLFEMKRRIFSGSLS
jgi:hypothetical protein